MTEELNEQQMQSNSISDLNYEEISCDRGSPANASFANGLLNYRFSVSPSGGGGWIPSMSYFLIEYNFGAGLGASDAYTATEALKQSQKITLANDWVSSMFVGASFRMAGVDISNINSALPQVSVLKKRLRLNSNQIDFLSGDMNGYEPDFSKRLAKSCMDGVYHRDGLIDASAYNSQALGPYNIVSASVVLATSGKALGTTVGASGIYSYDGAGMQTQGAHPVAGNWLWLFSRYNGVGAIAYNAADTVVVQSFTYTFPATSATADADDAIIDGTLIKVGDKLSLDAPGFSANANYPSFINAGFTVAKTEIVGDAVKLTINITSTLCTIGVMKVMYDAAGADKFTLYQVTNNGVYSQSDPRSNVVNNQVVWQPALSIFDEGVESMSTFVSDMQIILTPNSNWKTAAVESAVGSYDTDVQHGVDYALGIKSMRFYIARCRSSERQTKEVKMSMTDYIVVNKQLTSNNATLDFTIPPSTRQVVVFVQDAAAGTNTKIPLSRFKMRQYSPASSLQYLNRYGPWARTADEKLKNLQVTFSGITKPQTNIENTHSNASHDAISNTMLQRYLMTNQMDGRYDTEQYYDFLSNGPYYLFDYTRDSKALGTYISVKLSFDGALPTDGGAGNITSNVNLYICAIYNRDVAINYSEFGNVISVVTAMQ